MFIHMIGHISMIVACSRLGISVEDICKESKEIMQSDTSIEPEQVFVICSLLVSCLTEKVDGMESNRNI